MNRLITSILSVLTIGMCACNDGAADGSADDTSGDNDTSTDNATGQITASTVTPDGIYEIESWTRNSTDCSSAGLDSQGTVDYVVAAKTSPDGKTVFKLVTCETLEECDEIRQSLVENIEPVSTWNQSHWAFSDIEADGFSGMAATVNAGTPDDEGMCYEYAVDRLELTVQDDTLTIVIEHTTCDEYPADAQGACTEEDAIAASTGNPCYNRSDMILQKVAD